MGAMREKLGHYKWLLWMLIPFIAGILRIFVFQENVMLGLQLSDLEKRTRKVERLRTNLELELHTIQEASVLKGLAKHFEMQPATSVVVGSIEAQ